MEINIGKYLEDEIDGAEWRIGDLNRSLHRAEGQKTALLNIKAWLDSEIRRNKQNEVAQAITHKMSELSDD